MLRQAIAAVLAGQPVPGDLEAKSTPQPDTVPMIESLNERAAKAVDAQEWARAVDLLSQAAQLDPNDTKIAEKLTEVERTARLSSLYKTGHRAVVSGRWDEAINHFNVIVELEPGYKDVSELLVKAHKALKRDDTQQFVLTRYREGLAHFEGERWQGAVEAFREVQQISPGYERVEPLLAEAEQLNNPSLIQKVGQRIVREVEQDLWRWSIVAIGIVIIIGLTFLAFGNNNRAAGNDDVKQHLKLLYEEAQQAIENGNKEVAVVKLEQILSEDPDYADAADIRRELLATATPTSMPTPTIVIATPAPEEDPLVKLIEKAQEGVELALWAEAINTLNEVRSADAEYQAALVSSLFCDAYAGRGLEYLTNIESQDEKNFISLALADFEAGVTECPRRTDLKDQVERATAYLKVLNTSKNDYDVLIPMLTPLVAADPDYADGNAKNLLYRAYLDRGVARQESPATLATALGDFEAALALNVDDPGEAQTHRAELLLLFSQQAIQPSPLPAETAISDTEAQTSGEITPTREATPTVEPVRIKYRKPQLISPVDDIIFAGEFSQVLLEWEPIGALAEDEYYDLTIMYLFADEPKYTGSTRTRENQIQLSTDIGVGEAADDRFYWWVTVRKDNSAPTSDSLDLPLSPRSDAKTFVWAP
jgi:outer membrane protein assembly factor BamD (BamD/ComL family)